MIDWPNALVGFGLGVATTLTFWMIDRRRAKRQRYRDTLDLWKAAAKEIELMLYRPETTASDLYVARVRYPIDSWRAVLGPDSFRLLERLENAYGEHEHFAQKFQAASATQDDRLRLERSQQERKDAIVAFANFSRRAQSAGYHEVVTAEGRAQLRRDYLRHPIRTAKREHRSRKTRKAAGLS